MGAIDPDFGDMIANAPCGYITLHANGRVEHVNGTFLKWSGHAADQMTGKRFSEFLTLPGRIYYETHIAPLLRMQGSFNEFAIDMLTVGDEPLQMIANANERRDPGGEVLGLRIALIKATDRRRYEQELLSARELAIEAEKATQAALQLEHETSELREQFIAVLGHDLRNPLASISAGARILGRTVQGDKEHQVIAMLETTVVRMASMINNVLDFARGRLGGGITLERTASKPLEPVLVQVVDELRMSAHGRTIATQFVIDRPVNCDRTRIGQLLSNLLGNATTHGSANKPIIVHAETRDGSFELWVANSGEPIPPESIEKLFEPFFRGKVRASREGLGLGLYIASQIAKAHGGTLTVASGPDETRFNFSMPLVEYTPLLVPARRDICRGSPAQFWSHLEAGRTYMCNLYSITTNQAAIIALFRVVNRYVGNLAPMPGVFPDYQAPIVRNGADGRELATARWGMPSSSKALMDATKKRAEKLQAKGKPVGFNELLRMEPDSGTTNIRNVKSKHWTRWLGPANRCVVPFNSFSEFNKARGGDIWFALDETRPLACFAGIWTNWTSVRKVKEGETTNDFYAFLTTEPNAEVGAIHPKAMPVILTTPDDVETWMTAPPDEALKLQRPLSDGALRIVARGVKEDSVGTTV